VIVWIGHFHSAQIDALRDDDDGGDDDSGGGGDDDDDGDCR